MRPVMTVMGSLILAGNLLLAVPVRQNTLLIRNAEQSERDLRGGVAEALVNRGIEAASASHLVTERYGRYDRKLAQAFMHLSLLFPELKRETILAYMADRILHDEAFAFDNYDHLVAMLHRLRGVDLTPAH